MDGNERQARHAGDTRLHARQGWHDGAVIRVRDLPMRIVVMVMIKRLCVGGTLLLSCTRSEVRSQLVEGWGNRGILGVDGVIDLE